MGLTIAFILIMVWGVGTALLLKEQKVRIDDLEKLSDTQREEIKVLFALCEKIEKKCVEKYTIEGIWDRIESLEAFALHPPKHKIGDKHPKGVVITAISFYPRGCMSTQKYVYTGTVIKSGAIITIEEEING